mgnify:CR=1 FL=1
MTFGNHDFQCGLDNAEIESICREFPGCINPERAADGTTGIAVKHGVKHDVGDMEQDFGLPEQPVIACAPGTFALSVTDVDRTYDVLGLVLWIRAITRVPAATEARRKPRCASWRMRRG